MFEWLAQNHPDELIGLVAVLGTCLVILTTVVSAQWRRVRQAELQLRQVELEASLKHELVARGMSADEIRQVLEARMSGAGAAPSAAKQVARSA